MYVFQFPATGSVEGEAVAGVGPGEPMAVWHCGPRDQGAPHVPVVPGATGRRGADRPAAAGPHSGLAAQPPRAEAAFDGIVD